MAFCTFYCAERHIHTLSDPRRRRARSLEVAGLVRPQASEGRRDRRRLQADGRDGGEIHGIGHDVLPNGYGGLRRPEDTPAVKPAEHDLGTAEQTRSRRWHEISPIAE